MEEPTMTTKSVRQDLQLIRLDADLRAFLREVCSGQCLALAAWASRLLRAGCMTMYLTEYNCYPAHQFRLGDPADTRIRWFHAMAGYLAGYRVQSCPATPGWEVARNNSYGYNYKYLGSVRDNVRAENPCRPYEGFPVGQVRSNLRSL
jgi:hypothetical protein